MKPDHLARHLVPAVKLHSLPARPPDVKVKHHRIKALYILQRGSPPALVENQGHKAKPARRPVSLNKLKVRFIHPLGHPPALAEHQDHPVKHLVRPQSLSVNLIGLRMVLCIRVTQYPEDRVNLPVRQAEHPRNVSLKTFKPNFVFIVHITYCQ